MSSASPRYFLALTLCGSACSAAGTPPTPAAATAHNWAGHGFDDAETRFSTLRQISTDNVKQLGLAWSVRLAIHTWCRSHANRHGWRHVCHGAMEHRARD